MGQENLLAWLAHSLGAPFAVIFLFLSVALVALIVVSILAVRRDSVVPPALIQGLEVRLGEDRFQEACDLVRADRSVLARVLAAGLPHISTSITHNVVNNGILPTGSVRIISLLR